MDRQGEARKSTLLVTPLSLWLSAVPRITNQLKNESEKTVRTLTIALFFNEILAMLYGIEPLPVWCGNA
jgi:hypothetical protein